MNSTYSKIRNLGISAHIDAGKTTLTERILFYTRRIHAMHDVKGKDGVGATMDYMDLERERGITITSAATYCSWRDYSINIIDTPGHVDFTIEVERSLRVLDGAILVLCSVGGVQSQSITVDHQMARYNVPFIAFINKCDRPGADPYRVVAQIRDKLGHNAVMVQIPIGIESTFEGVIDLVAMKALYYEGDSGEKVVERAIPDQYQELAIAKREDLINELSKQSDTVLEAALEGNVSAAILKSALRDAVIKRAIVPVLLGSAYKNKAVQTLLDAVIDYLPSPLDVVNTAQNLETDQPVALRSSPDEPLVALAFKLEDGPYGQLTYIRVYQGAITKSDTIVNVRTGKKVKVGRLVRMHADKMEEIETVAAGSISALFGIDCASGDTFVSRGLQLTMSPMHIPKPVLSMAITPVDTKSEDNMSKALTRFTKEDPTFTAHVDLDSGQTIISGMGELHLDVYVERMRREYGTDLAMSPPQVAYREAITQRAEFDYTHKKQSGGSGQYGRVIGYLEPIRDAEFEFENKVFGGSIPGRFMLAIEKSFRKCLEKGPLFEHPVTGIRVVITDGAAHTVDSSDPAFQAAARGAFIEAYPLAKPVIMEPIMKVAVEIPSEYQGVVLGSLNQRRGIIIGTQDEGQFCLIEAQVPLAEMFGYATVLRSATKGKGQFTMEFFAYRQAPKSVVEELQRKATAGKHRVA